MPFDFVVPANPHTGAYPHVIQAAALVFNTGGELIESFGNVIKIPTAATVAPGAEKIHGISKEKSLTDGVLINDFFDFLLNHITVSCHVIAHNIKFDNFFLCLEAKRVGVKLPKYFKFCTMKSTKKMVGKYKTYGSGLKNPNLTELVAYSFFNGVSITIGNTHDANVDVKLCALCFFKLKLHTDCE